MEMIEDPIEIDGVGQDDVPPLFWREGRLARLVEKVLVYGLPGSAGPVPSGKGSIDLE